MADQYAREVASDLQNSVPDEQRREASLSHPLPACHGEPLEGSLAVGLEHVRPERRYSPRQNRVAILGHRSCAPASDAPELLRICACHTRLPYRLY